MKRFRCNKCGMIIFTEEFPTMCMEPFSEGTSGICGGEYIMEPWIDFDEWKKQTGYED